MRTTNFSEARQNLKKVFDQVAEDADPTLITRRNGQNVVVMSEREYDGLMETAHLLSSPANVRALETSQAHYERGDLIEFDPTAE